MYNRNAYLLSDFMKSEKLPRWCAEWQLSGHSHCWSINFRFGNAVETSAGIMRFLCAEFRAMKLALNQWHHYPLPSSAPPDHALVIATNRNQMWNLNETYWYLNKEMILTAGQESTCLGTSQGPHPSKGPTVAIYLLSKGQKVWVVVLVRMMRRRKEKEEDKQLLLLPPASYQFCVWCMSMWQKLQGNDAAIAAMVAGRRR